MNDKNLPVLAAGRQSEHVPSLVVVNIATITYGHEDEIVLLEEAVGDASPRHYRHDRAAKNKWNHRADGVLATYL